MKPVREMNRASGNESPRDRVDGAVVDPVCGMTINPDAAAGAHEYNGQTYYFCSTHCLNKFREDPERFLDKSPEATTSQSVGIQRTSNPSEAPASTCPMHPEVRQDKPGSCPKCGMPLEPVTVTAPQQKIEYTCPMHPQIVRDAPGGIVNLIAEGRIMATPSRRAHVFDLVDQKTTST
jgi:Cu+-exporting ATPase